MIVFDIQRFVTIGNFKSNTLLSGTSGNDSIANYNLGKSVTINAGAGNDSIYNDGDNVTIYGGAGNDTIFNYFGSSVTIDGGAGNDFINVGFWAGATIIKAGVGNDTIFNPWYKSPHYKSFTLEVGSYTSVTNGNDKLKMKPTTKKLTTTLLNCMIQ